MDSRDRLRRKIVDLFQISMWMIGVPVAGLILQASAGKDRFYDIMQFLMLMAIIIGGIFFMGSLFF